MDKPSYRKDFNKNQEKWWRIDITKTFGHLKKKILEL
jgi:hypothetical protein